MAADDANTAPAAGHVTGRVPDVTTIADPEHPAEHRHDWVFVRTSENWWDGDEEDIYHCTVEGCDARKYEYIPR